MSGDAAEGDAATYHPMRVRATPSATRHAAAYRDGMDAHESTDGMTDDEKRRDQLLRAPDAVEEDAAPRIVVSSHEGRVRIDIAEDATVRPGLAKPQEE